MNATIHGLIVELRDRDFTFTQIDKVISTAVKEKWNKVQVQKYLAKIDGND